MLSTLGIVSKPVMWVIRNVFHDTRQLAILGRSSDKMFDWVFSLCLLVLAAAITGLVGARSPAASYIGCTSGSPLGEFAVATTMVYRTAKFISLQMSAPSLTRLLEPCDGFSPMGVLWASIGASFPSRVVGSAELLAAVLLFVPMTVTLGGIVSLVDSLQIFTLNMTYDVPVKLFSFHLVVMSLFILAPDIPRLFRLLLLNQPAPASAVPPLGRRRRVIQAGIALQILLGAFFLWRGYSGSLQSWSTFGGGAPRPPLYGVWVIDRMTIDGIERAALVSDYERWRRVVVQTATSVTFWRMDDTPYTARAQVDLTAGDDVDLRAGDQRKTIGTFSPASPTGSSVLDGALNGRKIRMERVPAKASCVNAASWIRITIQS